MAAASPHFSQSYQEARSKFLAAAQAAGLALQSHPHPLPGRDGERLAMDVVRTGAAAQRTRRLVILSSACHGVEGFCGSGLQHALLTQLPALALPADAALLFIHALNPYGFSWLRRVTHENVDLNRNFLDFGQPLPHNPAYAEVHPLVVPPSWPPSAEHEAAVQRYIRERGLKAWQAAVSAGQYQRADGLFFGGCGPTWSNTTLRAVLREHAAGAAEVAWVDVHTGLGPSGHGERIHCGPHDGESLARCKRRWGPLVTSTHDGSSTSAQLNGLMWQALPAEAPQARFDGIALEFGTQPLEQVMQAMRAEQWLTLHPETGAAQHAAIKQRMREAFYTDTEAWKAQVLAQGEDCVRLALQAG